jgi:hypothetical protein
MDTEPLIREVRDAADRVAASREAVEEARRALHRAALRALIAVEGDADRERALVRTLYWDVPELPVRTIEVVVGGPAAVRARAGTGPRPGRGGGAAAGGGRPREGAPALRGAAAHRGRSIAGTVWPPA